jgi:hypothetical protein
MAISLKAAQYTTGASTVDLTTVLGLSSPVFVSHLVVRAAAANAGIINVGASNVTGAANAGAYLDAAESLTLAVETGGLYSNQVYFAASVPTDVIHVIALS